MRREAPPVQRAGTVHSARAAARRGKRGILSLRSGLLGERGSLEDLDPGEVENARDLSRVKSSGDGCDSDGEMAEAQDSFHSCPSVSVTRVEQLPPSKDKPSECVPESPWRQQTDRCGVGKMSWAAEEGVVYSSGGWAVSSSATRGRSGPWTPPQPAHLHWMYEYESQSDSDADRPEPDVVLDDLASRRFRSPSPVTPANYALPISPVDTMATARSPRQRVTPCHIQQQTLAYLRVRVGLQDAVLRELYEASEDEEEGGEVGYADPVQDDLYSRRVGLSLQPSKNVAYDKFLPKFWTPEEDAHVRKIKLGSQRRPWYRKMQGFRSKSTSSIPVDQGQTALWKLRCEALQTVRDKVKESEEQRRDDLTRWMSHRRCVNSDLERKREEREELAAGGSAAKEPEPFWEMQRGESRGQGSSANDSPAFPSTRQAVFSEPRPRTGSLLSQIHTADSPYTPGSRAALPPAPCVQSDSSYTGALSPDSTSTPPSIRTGTSQAASASTSNASMSGIATPAGRSGTKPKGQTSGAPAVQAHTATTDPTSSTLANRTSTTSASQTRAAFMDRVSRTPPDRTGRILTGPSGTSKAKESSVYKASAPRSPIGGLAGEKSPGASYNLNSMDTKPAAAQVSAPLPRSARRSDSSRLASVVSPRPFGTQSTRVAPVFRAFAMEDSHKRFNGETKRSQNSSVLSQQRQILTPENEPPSLASSVQSSNEDREEEGQGAAPSHGPSFPHRTSCNPSQPKMASMVSSGSEVNAQQSCYSDTRVRLNQKPNSSQDFGFQTSWDSTGAFVGSTRQGSPAEQGQLRAGDVTVAVGSRRPTERSSEQWKGSMDATPQQGSVVLDVQRNGQNGSPEMYINTSNDFTSQPPLDTAVKTSHTFNSPAATDVDCKGMNGGFRPESMASKGSDPISLKNLKRRSEFFEQQGGSESAISDLQVPSISTSSNRASWDPKEERKRQEKWQQEQERLLQEKYKRDQEKLEEEWRRAQREALSQGPGCHEAGQKPLEADLRGLSPLSTTSPLSQTTPPPWEVPNQLAEREELEGTQLQGAELHREQAERKAEGEELGLQRKFEGEGQQTRLEVEEERKVCQQTKECPREQDGSREEEQWKGGSEGFAKIHPEISPSDRTKSKSTPELDEVDKPEREVASETTRATPLTREAQATRKKNRPLSQVELDRLQILEEMKKKTQLVTDSSWIRQRSTCVYKEPIHLGGGMRRYESLDNLNSARSWRQSAWPPSPTSSVPGARPQSAVSNSASSGGYTRLGSSTLPTSHSTGSLRQGPWSLPSPTSPAPPTTLNEEPAPEPRPLSQQRSSASTASLTSGDQSLEPEPEPKSDSETGSSTATPATPDSQTDCLSVCDLTTLLQAEEETAGSDNH